MEDAFKRKKMRYPIDESNLGGWAISKELLVQVSKMIKPHSTILELGSGSGTIELRKIAKVISIEHEPKYLHDYQPDQNSAHEAHFIPLDPETGWYDRGNLREALAGKEYDLIIVDGPKRAGRHGFMHNLDLFDLTAAIVLDDLQRVEIRAMADILRRTINRPYGEYRAGPRRWFAVFKSGPKEL